MEEKRGGGVLGEGVDVLRYCYVGRMVQESRKTGETSRLLSFFLPVLWSTGFEGAETFLLVRRLIGIYGYYG